MTVYNINKATEKLQATDIKMQDLEKEISILNKQNKDLLNNSMHETEKALELQKRRLNEKHQLILKNYSEQNKAKYKDNFDKVVNFYKSEIASLKDLLETEKCHRISSNTRRPIFSSGRYSEADFSTSVNLYRQGIGDD